MTSIPSSEKTGIRLASKQTISNKRSNQGSQRKHRQKTRFFYNSSLDPSHRMESSMPKSLPWSKQIERDLPLEIDNIGTLNLGYEDSLVESMGIITHNISKTLPSVVPISPENTSSVSDPVRTSPINNNGNNSKRDNPDPLILLKAQWGLLRKECSEPKTSLAVISKMRSQVLSCLRDTGSLDLTTIDLLDSHWDLLGEDRIGLFMEKMLSHKEDKKITRGDGPYSYLSGMIDSIQVTQRDTFRELLENQANTSADFALAAKSIRSFQDSVTDAEKIWRAQSSLCSDYMAKLESHLKKLTVQIETPKPEKPERRTQSVRDLIVFPPYEYYWNGTTYTIRAVQALNPQEMIILDQVSQIFNSLSDNTALTRLHPVTLYNLFMEKYQCNGGDIKKTMKELIVEAENNRAL